MDCATRTDCIVLKGLGKDFGKLQVIEVIDRTFAAAFEI